ncbi:MAG: PQQ-dependent sugar dehydrogenase [Verrucomicrobiales bacterium]|nr:PQQ-dependent sugar dehydrogenase [Verrucomicrobiales bacterium]
MNVSDGGNPVRITKDPRSKELYFLKLNGEIYRINLADGSATSTAGLQWSQTDHGLASTSGMAISPDGMIYLVGNTTTNINDVEDSTFATIVKGLPERETNRRTWSVLAVTEPYLRSKTAFDHTFNGITVSPDGSYLYVNSGSRTDHGETHSGQREVGLTACILRLPASASHLTLPNNRTVLKAAGYIFAEGLRNTFDLAFDSGGNLFGTENGPDRDMSEELNWLREGQHYGFPWRIGGADNPTVLPDYDPAKDKLLDARFVAAINGFYYYDPAFPPKPANVTFAEPILNLGPDADSYRDPVDGSLKDASERGETLHTFTAHRSPLGLVFDTAQALASPYRGDGFMCSWTAGNPTGNSSPGPFRDASQDLLHLKLIKLGSTNYSVRVTRIVEGFSNPIDCEITGNRIYVLEHGGMRGIWEITLPAEAVETAPRLGTPVHLPPHLIRFDLTGAAGRTYDLQTATNLAGTWSTRTNLSVRGEIPRFTDVIVTEEPKRFYRAVER